MSSTGEPPSSGLPQRRQPFSSLAAMAWAVIQVDPTVPEHSRLIARDQLIEACRRENIWAATFLAGMLSQACAGIAAHDPAWFLTGRIDATVNDDRVHYLSRIPSNPMLVPRREGVAFDEPAWWSARDAAADWSPAVTEPVDPESTRWGRLIPSDAADPADAPARLRHDATDLLFDRSPADRSLALVSFALRSPLAVQCLLRAIGDEAWQRAGEQGLQFPARDGAAARAMTTTAMEAIAWGTRRSALYLHGAQLAAGREDFLTTAETVALFANPGHFVATEAGGQSDLGLPAQRVTGPAVPESVRWMDPGLLAEGPPWTEQLVAGMRALVLPGPVAARPA